MRRNPILESLTPFLVIGVSIAAFIGLILILFHVIVWGILIGGFLWVVITIKDKFFTPQKPQANQGRGRVIEHDEIQ